MKEFETLLLPFFKALNKVLNEKIEIFRSLEILCYFKKCISKFEFLVVFYLK